MIQEYLENRSNSVIQTALDAYKQNITNLDYKPSLQIPAAQYKQELFAPDELSDIQAVVQMFTQSDTGTYTYSETRAGSAYDILQRLKSGFDVINIDMLNKNIRAIFLDGEHDDITKDILIAYLYRYNFIPIFDWEDLDDQVCVMKTAGLKSIHEMVFTDYTSKFVVTHAEMNVYSSVAYAKWRNPAVHIITLLAMFGREVTVIRYHHIIPHLPLLSLCCELDPTDPIADTYEKEKILLSIIRHSRRVRPVYNSVGVVTLPDPPMLEEYPDDANIHRVTWARLCDKSFDFDTEMPITVLRDIHIGDLNNMPQKQRIHLIENIGPAAHAQLNTRSVAVIPYKNAFNPHAVYSSKYIDMLKPMNPITRECMDFLAAHMHKTKGTCDVQYYSKYGSGVMVYVSDTWDIYIIDPKELVVHGTANLPDDLADRFGYFTLHHIDLPGVHDHDRGVVFVAYITLCCMRYPKIKVINESMMLVLKNIAGYRNKLIDSIKEVETLN